MIIFNLQESCHWTRVNLFKYTKLYHMGFKRKLNSLCWEISLISDLTKTFGQMIMAVQSMQESITAKTSSLQSWISDLWATAYARMKKCMCLSEILCSHSNWPQWYLLVTAEKADSCRPCCCSQKATLVGILDEHIKSFY